MASAVNSFNSRCPNSQLVIVGYSQGGQVADNAFCGGPDANQGYSTATPAFNAAAMSQIKAVIEMGNPRYRSGVAYQVGSCRTQGFSPRPQGYSCSVRMTDEVFVERSQANTNPSPPARSKATATARTPTAARATMPTCTRATARCTGRLRSLSSRASSAAALEAEEGTAAAAAPLPPAQEMRLRLLRRRVGTVLLSGGSVVGKGESFYLFLSLGASWSCYGSDLKMQC